MIRIRLVYALFVIVFLLIISRLFYWQIIKGENLKAKAITQYSVKFLLPALRGIIMASDLSPIVVNQPAYLIYATPHEIKDKSHFANIVSSILSLPDDYIADLFDDPNRLWVPIANNVETEIKDQLIASGLKGLGYESDSKRFYPEASMAAHLIGFVGKDDDGSDIGYFGLEGYYDRQLRGKNGLISSERDASGDRIMIDDAVRIEPENGLSLLLWLDNTIQMTIESHLADGISRYGAKAGSIVIINPRNGGILGMASYPSYDPSYYSNYNDNNFRNPIVATSYEPGSTFKVLIMAKALDSGIVNPDTILEENGPLKISDYTIRTWNDQYHGQITATQVLEYSSNVGMVEIGNKIGKTRLLEAVGQFGLGGLTGIDLQDEFSPSLRNEKDWTSIDLATLTFGQGIAVTPIQMVSAIAAIANEGWLMEPKVVKSIRDQMGNLIDIKPKKVRKVINTTAAKLLTEMMVSAVEKGEAKWAKPKGYRIAGKTGTAQIPVEGHYDENKTIASFVGFAPADDPQFVMLVTLKEPAVSPWGSETAAPLFFSITKDLFLHLGITPADI